MKQGRDWHDVSVSQGTEAASGRQKPEEAGGSTGSESLAVPAPWFWTSGLQKKCGLSHKFEGLWYSS